jgi:hypothetical protein
MDTLDNLIFTNGAEGEPVKKAAKKAFKKQEKKATEKVAKKGPEYSREYLSGLSSPKLRALCVQLGIKVRGDRPQMISDILEK